MDIAKIRRFLIEWVLPPRGIRAVCFLLSRVARGCSTIGKHRRTSDKLFVLGNGPSLKTDFERYRREISSCDSLVVNFMVTSELFFEIKPRVCLFLDGTFFTDPLHQNEFFKPRIDALITILSTKVDWTLEVVVPDSARNSHLVRSVSSNQNVTCLFFASGVPMPMDSEDWEGWLRNLHAAPGQNVLTTAIYLGIYWRYQETVVLGADMSFHRMMMVEQDTNRLYYDEDHYYGKERRYVYWDVAQTKPRRLADSMHEFSIVFAWFDKLRKLADYAGVRIINASSFSWIDAFERMKE